MTSVLDFYDNRATEQAEAERTRKAAPPKTLAAGARSESESKILNALRTKPATSMSDLERSTSLNSTALDFAYRALRDRGLVREVSGLLGLVTITAAN